MSSVVIDKHAVAQLLRGPTGDLSIRTHREATMPRGHLDCKYRELVRTYLRVSVWAVQLFADLK